MFDGAEAVFAAVPECLRGFANEADREGLRLFLVGGAVRDVLAGLPVKDYDVASAASTDEFRSFCGSVQGVSCFDVGELFGTVGAVLPDTGGGSLAVEHTTFRSDSYEPGTRRPAVSFGTSLVEDLARRDFTLNSVALDLVTGELVDPFGGVDDLCAGVLRTPDDPARAFTDDPLRVLRMVRFAALRGFVPSFETVQAAAAVVDRLEVVSVERRTAELVRIFDAGGCAMCAALELLDEIGACAALFERLPDVDRLRSPASPDIARLLVMPNPAVLADADDCFAALAAVTAPGTAFSLLRGLRLPTSTVSTAAVAAKAAMTPPADLPALRRMCRGLASETFDRAVRLDEAFGGSLSLLEGFDRAAAEAPLPVDGHDALAAGLSGPDIAAALSTVEDAFCEDPSLTEAAALRVLADAAARRTVA